MVWAEKNVIHKIDNIKELLEEFGDEDEYDEPIRSESELRRLGSSGSKF